MFRYRLSVWVVATARLDELMLIAGFGVQVVAVGGRTTESTLRMESGEKRLESTIKKEV